MQHIQGIETEWLGYQTQGRLPYEKDRDVCQKFWKEPLKVP